MAYKIKDNCCNLCAICEYECPNEAISEGKTTFIINPDKCLECVGDYETPKCVEVCNIGCPVPDPDREESKEQLLEKWRSLNPGKVPLVG